MSWILVGPYCTPILLILFQDYLINTSFFRGNVDILKFYTHVLQKIMNVDVKEHLSIVIINIAPLKNVQLHIFPWYHIWRI